MSRLIIVCLLLAGCATNKPVPPVVLPKLPPAVQPGEVYVVLRTTPCSNTVKGTERLYVFYRMGPEGEKFKEDETPQFQKALKEYLEEVVNAKTLAHLAGSPKAHTAYYLDEQVELRVVDRVPGYGAVECQAEIGGKFVEKVYVLERDFRTPSKHVLLKR